jgi:hypothetical protein
VSFVQLFYRKLGLIRSQRYRVDRPRRRFDVACGPACLTPCSASRSCEHAGEYVSTRPTSLGTAVGLIFFELANAAKSRKQTPYNLLYPHLKTIAPFVVSKLCSNPTFAREISQLLSMGTTAFISVTLSNTLPHLFASCDRQVLVKVAQELDKPLYSLFITHSHEILAHVYLMSSSQQSDKSLSFILEILTPDAGDPSRLQLDSLIRSCMVELLTNLIITLGEENAERQETVSPLIHVRIAE